MPVINCYPHNILREKCIEVIDVEAEDVKKCIDTLYNTWNCISDNALGLSANQVGYNYRIFLMKTDNGPICIINPIILEETGLNGYKREYCFSLPGISRIVNRNETIKVSYKTEKWEEEIKVLQKDEARIFQHELDHLDGLDITDKSNDKFTGISKLKRLSRKYNGELYV